MEIEADLHLEFAGHTFRLLNECHQGSLEFVIPTLPSAAALLAFARHHSTQLEQADGILRHFNKTLRVRYQGLTLATLGQGNQAWALLLKTLAKL